MIFLRKHYKLVSALLFPCLILFIPVTSIPLDGLTTVEHRLIAIFALAALCWILEPIPVYATSLLVILLELVLVSDGGLLAFRAETGHAGFGSLFSIRN